MCCVPKLSQAASVVVSHFRSVLAGCVLENVCCSRCPSGKSQAKHNSCAGAVPPAGFIRTNLVKSDTAVGLRDDSPYNQFTNVRKRESLVSVHIVLLVHPSPSFHKCEFTIIAALRCCYCCCCCV